METPLALSGCVFSSFSNSMGRVSSNTLRESTAFLCALWDGLLKPGRVEVCSRDERDYRITHRLLNAP